MNAKQHDTKALQDLDKQHYMHPFTDSKAMHKKGTRIITGADGCYIYDSEGGKVLDGMAGLWCVAIGYGHVVRPLRSTVPRSSVGVSMFSARATRQ